MRAWRLLLLAACLLYTQIALAAHGIEHALAAHDEPCVECLVLPGFSAPPPTLSMLPAVAAPTVAPDRAVPPAPTVALHRPYLSRAPPLSPSR